MKFGKYFTSCKPDVHCIQYNALKHGIKKHPVYFKLFWKSILLGECKRFDKIKTPTESHCLLNTDALYKISKKIEKKLGVKSLSFFKDIVKTRRFRFTSVSFVTLLQ